MTRRPPRPTALVARAAPALLAAGLLAACGGSQQQVDSERVEDNADEAFDRMEGKDEGDGEPGRERPGDRPGDDGRASDRRSRSGGGSGSATRRAEQAGEAARAEPSGPPGWFEDGGRDLYDPDAWILATGTGPSAERAKSEALTGVARYFESRVASKGVQTSRNLIRDGEEHRTFLSSERTEISTEQHLSLVEYPRVEERRGSYYALAALNRERYATHLREQYEEHAERLRRYRDRSGGGAERSPAERLAEAERAAASVDAMRRLAARGEIVEPGLVEPPDDLGRVAAELRQRLRELRSRVLATRVVVDGPEGFASHLASTLDKLLTDAGVPTTPDREQARFVLRVELEVRYPKSSRDRWTRGEYSWSARLVQAGTSTSLGSWRASGDEAHVNRAKLDRALRNALGSSFEREALEELREALRGRVKQSRDG